MEQNPSLTWEEDSGAAEWKKYDNTYTFQWSILAEGIYETQENGEVPGVMWEDGSGTYSPSMDADVYQLRLSALAKPLAVELTSRYDNLERVRMQNGSVEEILDDVRFDYVMLVKMNGRTEVSAVKGKTVIYLRYYGHAQTDQILDAVAAKI